MTDAPRGLSARTLALVGSIGALSGLVEVVVLGIRRVAMGRLVFVPEYFWWLAPFVNAIIVAVVCLAPLWIAGRLGWLDGRARWLRFGLAVGMSVGASLLLIGGLHRAATVALALGAAVRLGAMLERIRPRLERLAWPALAATVLVLPGAARLAFGLPGGTTAARGTPSAGMPNVLLIVLDTVRAIELSWYGYDRPTSPRLGHYADSGVVFANAFSTAPWTLPSHGSLFTGMWAHQLSTEYRFPLDRTFPTLAERLRAAGYRTAGFVANTEFATAETGLARGFEIYQDHAATPRRLAHLTRLSRTLAGTIERAGGTKLDKPGRVSAGEINRRTLSWLDRNEAGPAFVFLNYYDAHTPYAPPEPYWSQFVGEVPRRPLDIPAPPDRVPILKSAYDGAIAALDAQVGALLDSLAARGFLENTLVVITSDHGEEFLEHGVLGHSNSLYLPSVQVPLAIRWPGRLPAGCRSAGPVSLRDIPETVATLIGLPERFPGRSLFGPRDSLGEPAILTSVLDEAAIRNLDPRYPASRGSLVSAQIGPHRLIRLWGADSTELYDVEADPLEQRRLTGPTWSQTVAELDRALAVEGIGPNGRIAVAPRPVSSRVSNPLSCPR